MNIFLRLFKKGKSIAHVKPHTRAGKFVHGHERKIKPGKKKRKLISLKLGGYDEIKNLMRENYPYLIKMGRVYAESHGLAIQFVAGQPRGDIEDLVAEGQFGMLRGGAEWMNTKKPSVDLLTQMKTRAKHRMRRLAKKLRGSIDVPYDVTRELAILSSARERYKQLHSGYAPSNEQLAEAIRLRRRTSTGYVNLDYDERLARIEVLREFKQSQKQAEFGVLPHVDEADVAYWTKHTYEQRLLRERVHDTINTAVKREIITKLQRKILFMRHYIETPEKNPSGRKVRSFRSMADMLTEEKGLKHVKMRATVGESVRVTPVYSRKIRTGKKRGQYEWIKYKKPITGTIAEIKSDHYFINSGNQIVRVPNKPPYMETPVVGHGEIHLIYTQAIEKLKRNKTVNLQLLKLWESANKSIIIYMKKSLVLPHVA